MDYGKLGLKVGIEIHQQLDTKKLFCDCPSVLRDDNPHFTIRRELRASAGETDEVDVAALAETKKEKYLLYEGYNDTTCLVELDEEPPHDLNREALSVVLSVANELKAKIVDEIQVMRKIVVDGSNTSGFQRTALVAIDGVVVENGKKIGIPTICIEEESAKIIEKSDTYSKYRLDRLGVPLIEIATDPDIRMPEEAKAVAERIGMILRSTGKVKRGLGTIRQDVNVSITGGTRIEIKGAQDLKLIPLLIENEVKRQINLLAIKDELKARKAKKIDEEMIDITAILKNTAVGFVKKAIDSGKKAHAIRIPSFSGLIKKEEVKNQRLGFEFGTFAKALGLGGVIHSDEDLPKYGFSEEEISQIKKDLHVEKNDAFLICTGEKERVRSLFNNHIIPRANHAMMDVPKEVRAANPDGTTTFMRPMPGGARMYPETDVAPIRPDTKNVGKIELIEEKKERIEGLGLSNDLATLIAKSGRSDEFEEYVRAFSNLKPAFIAEAMIPKLLEIKRKHDIDIGRVDKQAMKDIFSMMDAGRIAKVSLEPIVIDVVAGKSVVESVKNNHLELLSEKELEAEVKKIIEANKGLEEKHLVGKLMGALRGKAESEKIMLAMKKLSK